MQAPYVHVSPLQVGFIGCTYQGRCYVLRADSDAVEWDIKEGCSILLERGPELRDARLNIRASLRIACVIVLIVTS